MQRSRLIGLDCTRLIGLGCLLQASLGWPSVVVGLRPGACVGQRWLYSTSEGCFMHGAPEFARLTEGGGGRTRQWARPREGPSCLGESGAPRKAIDPRLLLDDGKLAVVDSFWRRFHRCFRVVSQRDEDVLRLRDRAGVPASSPRSAPHSSCRRGRE